MTARKDTETLLRCEQLKDELLNPIYPPLIVMILRRITLISRGESDIRGLGS